MKYTAAILLLVGVISSAEAMKIEDNSLVQINASNTQLMAESDSESEDDAMNVQLEGPCVYLDETQDELDYQVDMFSRTLDPRHWTNVVNIAAAIKKNTGRSP